MLSLSVWKTLGGSMGVDKINRTPVDPPRADCWLTIVGFKRALLGSRRTGWHNEAFRQLNDFFFFSPLFFNNASPHRKSWLTPTPGSSSGCWKRLQPRRNASPSTWLNHSLTRPGEWAASVNCVPLFIWGGVIESVFYITISLFRR